MSLMFETPADKRMGDIALPCFRFAKVLRKAPAAIASALAETLGNIDGVERCEAVNGYLNFFVSQSCTLDMLRNIRCAGTDYGRSDKGRGKRMIIDYSSPNIAKTFSIGHLRSTMIGNSLKLILQKCGYKTFAINYLGDWGTQFGKMIVAYKKWGNKEEILKDPINKLTQLYVKFHEEAEKDPNLENEAREAFRKMELKDPEYLQLWQWIRNESLKESKQIYDLLDVTFDSYNGEAFYNDKMDEVVNELQQKGLLVLDNGAEIVNLGDDMPPALIKRSDGGSLYITRDLAAVFYRKKEYKFDKILYENYKKPPKHKP